jgi:IclR family KDG regulon transcriptional repressor
MRSQNEYRIAAIDRALLVLEALGARPGQGVTEIAQRLGLTKSIVFRILQTLEGRGFADREPERATWSLGYRLAVLGTRAGPLHGLTQAALPVMDALRDRTSENVNLVVRDGLQSHVVATREGRHSIRLFAQVGRHGPLHAGGGSMLLLAFAPDDVREAVLAAPLTRFTPRTVTDVTVLRGTVERIRRNGWNIAQSDLDDGAFSVAAPIRGPDGTVVAAISVAGALARFDEERRDLHLTAVLDAGRRISARLALGSADEAGSRAA